VEGKDLCRRRRRGREIEYLVILAICWESSNKKIAVRHKLFYFNFISTF